MREMGKVRGSAPTVTLTCTHTHKKDVNIECTLKYSNPHVHSDTVILLLYLSATPHGGLFRAVLLHSSFMVTVHSLSLSV